MALVLASTCGCGGGATTGEPSAAPPIPTSGPMLGGCPVLPADNPWNRDVSRDPVDPRSGAYIGTNTGGIRGSLFRR